MNLNRYWIGVIAIIPYAYMMLLKPWIDGKWDWKYVHAVWMDWQSLNTGVLALIASITALYVTSHWQRQENEKNRKLAKFLLPTIAESIFEFCQDNASLLQDAVANGSKIEGYSTDRYASKPARDLFEDLKFSIKHLDDKDTGLLVEVANKIMQAKAYIDKLYQPKKKRTQTEALVEIEDIDSAFLRLGNLLIIVGQMYSFGLDEIDHLRISKPSNHAKIQELNSITGMTQTVDELCTRQIEKDDKAQKIRADLNAKKP